MTCGRWMAGALVAMWAAATAAAHAQPGRPRVWLLAPGPPGAPKTTALLRAELSAWGFVVEERPAHDRARILAEARLAGAFAAVVPTQTADWAAAEVHLFNAASKDVSQIDAGDLAGRSEGEVMRVLGRLAVRVGELLRARAAPGIGEEESGRAPMSEGGPGRTPTTAREAAVVVRALPPTGDPTPRRPPPEVVVTEEEAVAARSWQLEGGVAAGRWVREVGLAFGPAARLTWSRPSGLRLGVGVLGLTSGRRLAASAGSARVIQTLALVEAGYASPPWGGRLTPAVKIALGAQHTFAQGSAAPLAGTVDPQRFVGVAQNALSLAVSAGAALELRLGRLVSLAVAGDAFRLFRPPVIYIGDVVAGTGAFMGICLSTGLRLAL